MLGDFIASGSDTKTDTVGVFSSSSTLLDSSLLHRVPDAIDAGVDVSTSPTFFGSEPTDIPEDFEINTSDLGGTVIQVPLSAKFLFVSASDSLFNDNADPTKIYGVRITRFPSIPITVRDDGRGVRHAELDPGCRPTRGIFANRVHDLDSSTRGSLNRGRADVYLTRITTVRADAGEPSRRPALMALYAFNDLPRASTL